MTIHHLDKSLPESRAYRPQTLLIPSSISLAPESTNCIVTNIKTLLACCFESWYYFHQSLKLTILLYLGAHSSRHLFARMWLQCITHDKLRYQQVNSHFCYPFALSRNIFGSITGLLWLVICTFIARSKKARMHFLDLKVARLTKGRACYSLD